MRCVTARSPRPFPARPSQRRPLSIRPGAARSGSYSSPPPTCSRCGRRGRPPTCCGRDQCAARTPASISPWRRSSRCSSPAISLADLYPGFGLGPVESLRRTWLVTAFGFLVLAAFTFAVKLPHLYSRVTFAIALALSLIAVPWARALLLSRAAHWRWWREPVVVIGPRPLVARAIRLLRDVRRPDYRAVAVLDPGWPDAPSSGDPVEGVPLVGGLDRRRAVRAPRRPGRDPRRRRAAGGDHARPAAAALLPRRHAARVRASAGRGRADLRNLGGALTIEYTSNLLRPHNRAAKRAARRRRPRRSGLIVCGPLLVLAALAVRLASAGRPIFEQERSGLGGRTFSVLKVRTMYARRRASARGAPARASRAASRSGDRASSSRTTRG